MSGAVDRPSLTAKQQVQGKVLLLQLHMVVKTLRLHDSNNKALLVATESLRDTINTLWAGLDGRVQLQLVDGVAYLNDHLLRLDPTTKSQVDFLQHEFDQRELGGLAFNRPVDAEALRSFLQALTRPLAGPEEVSDLKQSLLKFRDQALELLDPRTHSDSLASEADLRVDRRTFGLQAYAKAVVSVREVVNTLRAGGDIARVPLNVTRIVQDLVDIGTERINFLMKLGWIKQASDYESNHAANTCVLALVIGRALHIERLELVNLGLSALFADLGFAMLQPELISHEHELSPQELAEVQQSMLHQVKTIFRSDQVSDAMMTRVIVAYEHHMAFEDPSRAQPLHPFSRIVAVADAFDALTTRRPWREGYAADEALKVLMSEAGSRFDPVVVKTLINLMGLYPIGSPVRLASGEIATVYHNSNDPGMFEVPWVRVIVDAEGQRIRRTVIRNLANTEGPGGTVTELLSADAVPGVDPAMMALG